MKITNNNNNYNYKSNCKQNFKAKFLNSASLKLVADYAVEHGKFDKLNQARKNIDSAYLQTRIRVDIGETKKGFPLVSFTRFSPKSNVAVAKTFDDYKQSKVTIFESSKNANPLKFALEKIIKMGNNAPHNNMYKKVVVDKK